MFHVAPDEAHGRVANDAVTQHEVFQLLQVRSLSLNPHICYAVGATKAQSLQAALGGDIQQMTIGKGRDIADNEMLQLGQGPRSGAAEPGSGDFTVTQLQCRKGRGDVLVGNGAEVCLCQAQPVELGTSLPEGGQQCRGEDPPLAAGVERAPYSQRLQAVAETLPDQVPKGLGADLGVRTKRACSHGVGAPLPAARRLPPQSQPPAHSGAIPPPPLISAPCLQLGDSCFPPSSCL